MGPGFLAAPHRDRCKRAAVQWVASHIDQNVGCFQILYRLISQSLQLVGKGLNVCLTLNSLCLALFQVTSFDITMAIGLADLRVCSRRSRCSNFAAGWYKGA